MADEAVKVAREGDPEVSEAIDFAKYYGTVGLDVLEQQRAEGAELRPRGVVVVASPWNFPYAIPAGGVLAALAAGNAVILKPPPEARRTALHLVEQLHRGGVPADVVQFVACPDNEVGQRLITPSRRRLGDPHRRATRRLSCSGRGSRTCICSPRPAARTPSSSPRPPTSTWRSAISSGRRSATPGRSARRRAWRSSRRRCTTTPSFMERLADATRSLVVGLAVRSRQRRRPADQRPVAEAAAWPAPSSTPANVGWSSRAVVGDNLWTPGVRVGVQPGSWFHVTECFGPVLGVMRADDLDHAIELQNGNAYGLTGGIHSLDDAEVERWLDGVHVGNAYINRGVTGAIVRRQPFGGWKRSSVGCGPKAGGPDYVAEMVTANPAAIDTDVAERSYRRRVDAVVRREPRSHRAWQRAQRPSLPTARWCAGSSRPRHARRRAGRCSPCRRALRTPRGRLRCGHRARGCVGRRASADSTSNGFAC